MHSKEGSGLQESTAAWVMHIVQACLRRCPWKARKLTCTSLWKAWLLQGSPSKCEGFEGAWQALTWAQFAFSKSLIDIYCQDACFFSWLAVQSHLTQQCQMKLQIWTSGHRSILWWLDLHPITIFQERAEAELPWAIHFGKLIFIYPKCLLYVDSFPRISKSD